MVNVVLIKSRWPQRTGSWWTENFDLRLLNESDRIAIRGQSGAKLHERRPHDGRSARFFQFGECKTRPGHVMVMTRAQFWLRPGGAQGRGRTKNTPPPFVRSPRWNCYNYSDGFVRSPLPLGPWPFQFIPNGRQTHTNTSPTFWFCFFLFLCFCLVFMPGVVSGDMSFKSCCFQ